MGACNSYRLTPDSVARVWTIQLTASAPDHGWPMVSERDHRQVARVAQYLAHQLNREPGHPDLPAIELAQELTHQNVPPLFINVVTAVHLAASLKRERSQAREEAWFALPDPPVAAGDGRQPLNRWMSSHVDQTLLEVPWGSSMAALPSVRVQAAWRYYLYTGGPAVSWMTVKEFKRELRQCGYSLGKAGGVDVIRGVELSVP